MATIVQGGPDLRSLALEQGVAQGTQNYFAARKKKEQEQRFLDAFKVVNESGSYEDAVAAIAKADPEILSNPQAMQLLQQQIDRKFPAQETLEVVDANNRRQVINYNKGRPPSDMELAARGLTRPSSVGLQSRVIVDEESGEVDMGGELTEQQAAEVQNTTGREVMTKEEAGTYATLSRAFSERTKARAAMKKAAQGPKEDKPPRPTQFEQEVDSIQQRLGLEDRNMAINVHKFRDPTIKEFRDFYAQNYGDVFEINPAAKAHITNSEQMAEPALASGQSAESTKKLMQIDTTYNVAVDKTLGPAGSVIQQQAAADFMRLTGLVAGDQALRNAVTQAGVKLEDGQVAHVELKDSTGKKTRTIAIVKVGGRVVPIGEVK